MPQLDITAVLAQIAGLSIGFTALFFFVNKHIIPKVSKMVKFRHTQDTNEKMFNQAYFKRQDVREYDTETNELVYQVAKFRVKSIQNLEKQYAAAFETNPQLSKRIDELLADSELKKNSQVIQLLRNTENRINNYEKNEKKS